MARLVLDRARLGAAVIALLACAATLLVAGPASATEDRDCGDFATQAQAQSFFVAAGGPSADPHALDAEGDGVACESLPCPCSTQTSGGQSPTGTIGSTSGSTKTTLRQRAAVVRVVDGDTVEVRLVSGAVKDVRLIGIDTPEVYGGVECGGPEASAAMKRMLPAGSRVLLVSDPSQATVDRYGRLLRYVVKSSTGTDVNRLQVRRGHARVYVYGGVPFQRTDSYRVAQRAAQRADLGLWGHC